MFTILKNIKQKELNKNLGVKYLTTSYLGVVRECFIPFIILLKRGLFYV